MSYKKLITLPSTRLREYELVPTVSTFRGFSSSEPILSAEPQRYLRSENCGFLLSSILHCLHLSFGIALLLSAAFMCCINDGPATRIRDPRFHARCPSSRAAPSAPQLPASYFYCLPAPTTQRLASLVLLVLPPLVQTLDHLVSEATLCEVDDVRLLQMTVHDHVARFTVPHDHARLVDVMC